MFEIGLLVWFYLCGIVTTCFVIEDMKRSRNLKGWQVICILAFWPSHTTACLIYSVTLFIRNKCERKVTSQ